jgi:hypothetical protein
MDDKEFLRRLKEKIERTAGTAIELSIDTGDPRKIAIELAATPPKVVFGSDALKDTGIARMFSQYAILALKERRQISEDEFLLYLRRN